MKINSKVHGEKPHTPEELQAVSDEFFKRILNRFDQMLSGKDFVCGSKYTVADIQYFTEISTVTKLLKREVTDADFPNVAAWMAKMQTIPEVAALEAKYDEVL